jgi:hypothetical protein
VNYSSWLVWRENDEILEDLRLRFYVKLPPINKKEWNSGNKVIEQFLLIVLG